MYPISKVSDHIGIIKLIQYRIKMTDKRYFYDDINMHRAILMQKWMILKLNSSFFLLIYLHHFDNYDSWTVY